MTDFEQKMMKMQVMDRGGENVTNQQSMVPDYDDGFCMIRSLTREDLQNKEMMSDLAHLSKTAFMDNKPCCCCLYQGFDETLSTYTFGLGEACDVKLENFGCVFVNSRLAGYVQLGYHDTVGNVVVLRDCSWLQEIPPRDTCHLEEICVSSTYRGKGLGKKLMRWADDKARNRGCTKIKLEVISRNTRAKALYEKVGYETQDTCCEQVICCPLLCCLMRFPYAYTMIKPL